jgi:hypothetical protein
MKKRSLPLALVACLAVALVASACSGSSSSGSRNAAGTTASLSESDLNEFCAPPRDNGGASGFATVRNIVTCFVLENQTKKFSAPNKLDTKVPLTVTKAYCSRDRSPCVNETGYYGDLRIEGTGNVYGWRSLTPDPFTGIGAIQFMPNKIWQGTDNRLFVNSSVGPFTLQQTGAQPEFSNPSSGTNGGNCSTQGSFIGCTLDQGSWQKDGTEQRPRYTFFTKPMRITINNNSGSPMSLSSPASPGRGFLVDPVAQGNVEAIATGGQAFIGGYRSTNSNDEQSWTASYCVDYKPISSSAAPTCIPVDITVKVAWVENKWVNQSQCVVNARTAAVTIKCDTPTMNDSDTDRIVSVNIKNF